MKRWKINTNARDYPCQVFVHQLRCPPAPRPGAAWVMSTAGVMGGGRSNAMVREVAAVIRVVERYATTTAGVTLSVDPGYPDSKALIDHFGAPEFDND